MAKDPYQYFRVEAQEILESLSSGALDLEQGRISKELMTRLLRSTHTLKGAARVVKQPEMADLAHAMEDLLSPYREAASLVPREAVEAVLRLIDACQIRLRGLAPASEKADTPEQPREANQPPREPEEPFSSVRVEIHELDAFLYQLAETGVHLRALSQESATVDRALRTTQRCLHQMQFDSVHHDVAPQVRRTEEHLQPVVEGLRTELQQHQRSLVGRLERLERDFGTLREQASELRLLPAHMISPYLERAVRDAALGVKKRVTFEVAGGEHRLDAHVLLAVRDALLHVVRNAVAHGIEPEAERIAAGKPAAGRVRLQVRKIGHHVAFVVDDDGRGLDVSAIRRQAIQQQQLSPAEAENLTLADSTQLLLQGGLSTAAGVSHLSGRGIGLDVVRSTATRLKGTVSLHSEPRRGVTLEIVVPVSLESLTAIAVQTGTSRAFIPLNAVATVVRCTAEELTPTSTGWALVVDDQAVPFRPLDSLLGAAVRRGATSLWTVVVLQIGTHRAALGVDRVAGLQEVFARPLPALTGPVPLVSGAVMDAAGDPQLVLDPLTLFELIRGGGPVELIRQSAAPRSILVVDDSLTTRMLEQSILEAAGFQVELASSGEEALEKARQQAYAMLIVDVEMPGMSGFELLELLRDDPQLQSIPAILVTSLAAPADRQRGLQAGARAYIVKSEFHEGQLLQIIRDLIGETAS